LNRNWRKLRPGKNKYLVWTARTNRKGETNRTRARKKGGGGREYTEN